MSDVYVSGFRTQTTGEQTVATYLWDTGSLAWVPQTASTGTGGAVNVTNTFIPSQQYGTWNVGINGTVPISAASTLSTTDTHTTAAAPISVRLTDGSAFYNASGGAGGALSTAAKGSTAAGSPTSEATDANTQSLHVKLVNGSLAVTGAFYQATQPVSIASPVAVTGTFYQATQPVSLASMPTTPVTGTFWQATQPVSIASMPSTAVTNAGTFAVQVTSAPTTPVTGTFFQATQPVSIAATVTTADAGNSTSVVSSVSASITTVTLKAANSARKGLAVNNDSTSILYLKLGATASSTSYTVKMAANSYFELPYNYTGTVDGIWVTATGAALITEVS